MSHEGASALTVQRDNQGGMWISIDSLVDLFEDMASGMADGPAKNNLTTLAGTFRPMSTYAEMEEVLADDGSTMTARRCDTCQAVVIDALMIGGRAVLIDAEPVPDGALFPMRVEAGVPMLAPWRPGLDGVTGVRLAEHTCPAVIR